MAAAEAPRSRPASACSTTSRARLRTTRPTGSSPSPTASTATCVPATRAGSRPSSWKPGGDATPDPLADGAERPAPVRRPAPPVSRTRAALDLLGAQVGQPDAAIGVAHPAVALRGAPLRHVALAWAP